MADAPFVWENLGTYKAEGTFLDGYPDDERTFFAPRDNVHGLLVALLGTAQHSIVVNMFGYDDDELNTIIQPVKTSWPTSEVYDLQDEPGPRQPGNLGRARKEAILAKWNNNAFGNSIAIGTSSVHNAMLST